MSAHVSPPSVVSQTASSAFRLQLFYEIQIVSGKLTEAFHALGLEAHVEFDHPESGRKKSVVKRVHLKFNPNEQLLAKQGVGLPGGSNSFKANRGERI